jgi:hypothetical protein
MVTEWFFINCETFLASQIIPLQLNQLKLSCPLCRLLSLLLIYSRPKANKQACHVILLRSNERSVGLCFRVQCNCGLCTLRGTVLLITSKTDNTEWHSLLSSYFRHIKIRFSISTARHDAIQMSRKNVLEFSKLWAPICEVFRENRSRFVETKMPALFGYRFVIYIFVQSYIKQWQW